MESTLGSFHVKWCKPGHDPSQNLITICKVVTILRYDNPEFLINILYGLGEMALQS